MTAENYLHGYTPAEQQRLLTQAEYWRDRVIECDLPAPREGPLLEVGCGAGANLRLFLQANPQLQVAGIDLEPRQIAAAQENLAPLTPHSPDLRVGDAAQLPWPELRFREVFSMWVLEHLQNPVDLLREAHRVLQPGGCITLIETDYDTFRSWPETPATCQLFQSLRAHFATHGCATAGRQLSAWLHQAGFATIEHRAFVVHYARPTHPSELQQHLDYTLGYIEPSLPALVTVQHNLAQLQQGVNDLKHVAQHPGGVFTQLVYRAVGVKS